MPEMKRAIIRPPSKQFRKCISSHPLHGTLDIQLALDQHKEYSRILEDLGLEIITLPADIKYPDSCFVEDTAIIHNNRAMITRMAKESRRGEEITIKSILAEFMDVNQILPPGTIEGGDVIHLSNLLISGMSQRTNREGISQCSKYLHVQIDAIEDPSIIHLKSHVTILSEDTVFVTQKFAGHPALKKYHRIIVPLKEEYAANTLTVNDHLLMSSRHPQSIQLVRDAGFDIIPINLSEFEKCEGALTCLSLLF